MFAATLFGRWAAIQRADDAAALSDDDKRVVVTYPVRLPTTRLRDRKARI